VVSKVQRKRKVQREWPSWWRSYSPEQLHDLNRLVALKDLRFSLDQVQRLLGELVSVDELSGMLRLRRAELEEEVRVVNTRLAAVESRLKMIEKENTVSVDYVVKTIPAVRLVARTATVDPGALIGRIEPMFNAVAAGLRHIPGSLTIPIATYAETEAGMDVAVGYEYAGVPPEGAELVDLPEAQPVCAVHLGSMSHIGVRAPRRRRSLEGLSPSPGRR
jgi:DNA-binding transcriptional MerR regulator